MSRLFRFVTLAMTGAAVAFCAQFVSAQTDSIAKPDAVKDAAKAYPEVEKAAKAFNERRVDDARKALEDAQRAHPELPPADLIIFKWFADIQQPNMARAMLERAVISAPSDPEPYVLLGNIALQERRVTEAEMDYAKAKALLANFTIADRKKIIETQTISGLGSVAEAREKWAAAQTQLTALLELSPKDTVALQRLARAQFWQNQAAEAYATLKKAKKIDLDNVKDKVYADAKVLQPEAILAQFYDQFEGERSKETGNARKWFKNALVAAPDDIPTRQVIALWALNQGDVAFAKEQSKKCLELKPGSMEAQILSGVIALWEKDFKGAEEAFQKAHIQQPINFAAKNNLALALCEQGDGPDGPAKLDQALGYALPNYQENQNNADALSTLGWVRYKRKEFDQAGLALSTALKASGGNMSSDTACYLAHVLYQVGLTGRAQELNQAKALLDAILDPKGKPFSMKKEASELRPKVEAKLAELKGKETTPAKTP